MVKSSEQTAEVVGVSPRKVEQALTVLDHVELEVKQQVLEGVDATPLLAARFLDVIPSVDVVQGAIWTRLWTHIVHG